MTESLDARFEAHRPHLLKVAYGTLGSVTDAEDVVQEAWLRLERVEDPDSIENLKAWLTVTVGRLALDTLRSARVRRERYVGAWLPEPVVDAEAVADPMDTVSFDQSISMALLSVLERLSPAERTAWLLHDIFAVGFDDIAVAVGRSPAAVRQLASRARRHIREARPRFPPTQAEQQLLVDAFSQACMEGDFAGLVELLDPDVVWRSDGGGKVSAARRPQTGATHVASAMIALARDGISSGQSVLVNDAPGLLIVDSSGVKSVISFTVDRGRIVAIDIVRNPEKLGHVVADPGG